MNRFKSFLKKLPIKFIVTNLFFIVSLICETIFSVFVLNGNLEFILIVNLLFSYFGVKPSKTFTNFTSISEPVYVIPSE